MSYIQDLTRYTYRNNANPYVLAVGWLDKSSQDMPTTGDPLLPSFSKLLEQAPTLNLYRGYHGCQWCEKGMGNGEMWFTGKSGKFYVMPVLVRHYVEAHGYRIPEEVQGDISGFLTEDEQTKLHFTEGELGEPRHVTENRRLYNKWSAKVDVEIAALEDDRVLAGLDALVMQQTHPASNPVESILAQVDKCHTPKS